MHPDPPGTNSDVPDNSAATAPWSRCGRHPTRHNDNKPGSVTAHTSFRVAVIAVAVVLACTLFPVTAQADSLDKHHKKVNHQIHQVKQDMSESSKTARDAAVSLTKAKAKLKQARSTLHKTRHRVHRAAKADAKLAAELSAQRHALTAAKKRVARGKRQVTRQKNTVGAIARDGFQRHSDLARLAPLTSSRSMGDLSARMQMSDTMLDTNSSTFDRLTALQHQLTQDQSKQAKLKRRIAADRAAAARNLAAKRRLDQRAKKQRQAVTKLVHKRRKAQAAADKAVAADKRHYAGLRKENKSVERRIKKRIAREKAKARKQAAAKRRAAQHASAKHTSSASGAGKKHAKRHTTAADHGFRIPVNGPITSPYGMRKHPILHVYKLHDGTDFGVGCGTPMRAAHGGKVTERYADSGYGNRLFIDHGRVDGSHITTVMNHATRYVVHEGQHVKKGQVVGYVGSTGYSTGCHMHVMVYKNGKKINPMSWF